MVKVIAQPTPNPLAYKFTLEGHTFAGPQTIAGAAEARGTPFEKLFAVPGVASVFATANFVTVTKTPDASWESILEPARTALETSF